MVVETVRLAQPDRTGGDGHGEWIRKGSATAEHPTTTPERVDNWRVDCTVRPSASLV